MGQCGYVRRVRRAAWIWFTFAMVLASVVLVWNLIIWGRNPAEAELMAMAWFCLLVWSYARGRGRGYSDARRWGRGSDDE